MKVNWRICKTNIRAGGKTHPIPHSGINNPARMCRSVWAGRNHQPTMPQLIKGGKYVFGWTIVHSDGAILIPPEAMEEYSFKSNDKLIVMSGSKTSRGFAITTINKILNTPILIRIKQFPMLYSFKKLKNGYIEDSQKIYTWSMLDSAGYFTIHPDILLKYYIEPGNKLLVGKGSGLALAFIKHGTIVWEACRHPELQTFK